MWSGKYILRIRTWLFASCVILKNLWVLTYCYKWVATLPDGRVIGLESIAWMKTQNSHLVNEQPKRNRTWDSKAIRRLWSKVIWEARMTWEGKISGDGITFKNNKIFKEQELESTCPRYILKLVLVDLGKVSELDHKVKVYHECPLESSSPIFY